MNIFETEAERYDRWFDRHPAVYKSEIEAIRAALPESHGHTLEIGNLQFWQTFFHLPDDISVPQPVMSDYGEGGFVAVAGTKAARKA